MMKRLFSLLILMSLSFFIHSQTFKVGSNVEVKWDASTWYPATVIEVSANQYKVHLDGDGNNHNRDQWINKDKGILRVGKANVNASSQLQPRTNEILQNNQRQLIGKRIEVKYSAYWYKATIIDQKGDSYKVHYDGYGSADDAWVPRSSTRDLDEKGAALTVACSFNPPPGTFTNSSPASDALFKKEIYDWYNRLVNGTLTRPTRIGVVFTMFSRQAAYKNIVTNEPGLGATRRHSGAPANTTIYPVKTTFFVCEDYNGEVSQKQIKSDFSFFINKDGEWTCSKEN